jgi:preprotein translocase subunit SecA
MIGAVARKLFGSANERRIRSYQPRVDAINALEAEVAVLTDDALKARTADLKKQVADGTSLDDILVPAFATVREAAKRTIGQRHFDMQLIGGMILHEGKIAEMKTGEGKTLVATLPVYLNALSGRGVHVVTVNDYLAQRDADWLRPLYTFCGVRVGCVTASLEPAARAREYDRDVTYTLEPLQNGAFSFAGNEAISGVTLPWTAAARETVDSSEGPETRLSEAPLEPRLL